MWPRDVVFILLHKLSFADFLRMRRVCRMWNDVSKKVDFQWYRWLERFGPRKIVSASIHKTHAFQWCNNPNCKQSTHYHYHSLVPRLMPTVSLYGQVMRHVTKRLRSQSGRQLDYKKSALLEAESRYERAQDELYLAEDVHQETCRLFRLYRVGYKRKRREHAIRWDLVPQQHRPRLDVSSEEEDSV